MDGLITTAERLLSWAFEHFKKRRNPVYQQAERVLEAFTSHGVACTAINALLPQPLQLASYAWSSPEALQQHLSQAHLDWLSQELALEADWLSVQSDCPHPHIFSYKAPELFYQWLLEQPELLTHKLHFITPDKQAIDASRRGYFALVLEQMPEDEKRPSRFYHLANGAHTEHWPCLVHLLQILAIAYTQRVILRRWQLAPKALYALSKQRGLAPNYLHSCSRHPLNPDHELWPHFSGHSNWLNTLRNEAITGLKQAGLIHVIEHLEDYT